jgi:hypothetical protein
VEAAGPRRDCRGAGATIGCATPRGVAQLAEHRSPKPGVAGSSPAAPAGTFPAKRAHRVAAGDNFLPKLSTHPRRSVPLSAPGSAPAPNPRPRLPCRRETGRAGERDGRGIRPSAQTVRRALLRLRHRASSRCAGSRAPAPPDLRLDRPHPRGERDRTRRRDRLNRDQRRAWRERDKDGGVLGDLHDPRRRRGGGGLRQRAAVRARLGVLVHRPFVGRGGCWEFRCSHLAHAQDRRPARRRPYAAHRPENVTRFR